jgi:hypothetical protein
VSSTVATVDIIAPDYSPGEFLGQEVQFVGGFRTTEHAKRLRTRLLDRCLYPLRRGMERLFPTGGTEVSILADQGCCDSVFILLLRHTFIFSGGQYT